jgi:tetratricopeptide (TPR) repeat protein
MLTKKKKISRREIKEDKLVTSYYKAYNFFDEHKQKFYLYGGILVVVVLAVLLYLNNKKQNNETAGTQLAQVMSLYDAGSYLEAIEGKQGTKNVGLKKIVQEYGSTENGEAAKIYLANSYMMLGKPDEAVKYFKDYSGGNPIYKATAIAGEAGYLEYKKEYGDAADLFIKASKISEENVLNPEYMFHAAVNYLKTGNTAKAKELLETVKKDYATAPSAREVDKYLTELN